jgi:hypothetical protein
VVVVKGIQPGQHVAVGLQVGLRVPLMTTTSPAGASCAASGWRSVPAAGWRSGGPAPSLRPRRGGAASDGHGKWRCRQHAPSQTPRSPSVATT